MLRLDGSAMEVVSSIATITAYEQEYHLLGENRSDHGGVLGSLREMAGFLLLSKEWTL